MRVRERKNEKNPRRVTKSEASEPESGYMEIWNIR